MHGWGFRVAVAPARTLEVVEGLFGEQGLVAERLGKITTYVVSDGTGGALVLSAGLPGAPALAGAICAKLGVSGRLVEVDLSDRDVGGSGYALAEDGTHGPGEDLDDEAGELCEEWFDGGKYRTDSADALIATLLGVAEVGAGGTKRKWKLSRPLNLPAPVRASTGPAEPPPFRVFRHPDAREWQVRAWGRELELRIRLDPEQVIARKRSFSDEKACAREAESLVRDQVADGFVEFRG